MRIKGVVEWEQSIQKVAYRGVPSDIKDLLKFANEMTSHGSLGRKRKVLVSDESSLTESEPFYWEKRGIGPKGRF